MTPVDPTYGFTIRFLWAITWRNFLISIGPIVIVGIMTAGILVSLGYTELANPIARLATLITSIAIGIPVTRSVFGKRLGKYKLVVVHADSTDST